MVEVKAIKLHRDKHNRIYAYTVTNGSELRTVDARKLKELIKNNLVKVTNLTLTTDNRLVQARTNKEAEPTKKTEPTKETTTPIVRVTKDTKATNIDIVIDDTNILQFEQQTLAELNKQIRERYKTDVDIEIRNKKIEYNQIVNVIGIYNRVDTETLYNVNIKLDGTYCVQIELHGLNIRKLSINEFDYNNRKSNNTNIIIDSCSIVTADLQGRSISFFSTVAGDIRVACGDLYCGTAAGEGINDPGLIANRLIHIPVEFFAQSHIHGSIIYNFEINDNKEYHKNYKEYRCVLATDIEASIIHKFKIETIDERDNASIKFKQFDNSYIDDVQINTHNNEWTSSLETKHSVYNTKNEKQRRVAEVIRDLDNKKQIKYIYEAYKYLTVAYMKVIIDIYKERKQYSKKKLGKTYNKFSALYRRLLRREIEYITYPQLRIKSGYFLVENFTIPYVVELNNKLYGYAINSVDRYRGNTNINDAYIKYESNIKDYLGPAQPSDLKTAEELVKLRKVTADDIENMSGIIIDDYINFISIEMLRAVFTEHEGTKTKLYLPINNAEIELDFVFNREEVFQWIAFGYGKVDFGKASVIREFGDMAGCDDLRPIVDRLNTGNKVVIHGDLCGIHEFSYSIIRIAGVTEGSNSPIEVVCRYNSFVYTILKKSRDRTIGGGSEPHIKITVSDADSNKHYQNMIKDTRKHEMLGVSAAETFLDIMIINSGRNIPKEEYEDFIKHKALLALADDENIEYLKFGDLLNMNPIVPSNTFRKLFTPIEIPIYKNEVKSHIISKDEFIEYIADMNDGKSANESLLELDFFDKRILDYMNFLDNTFVRDTDILRTSEIIDNHDDEVIYSVKNKAQYTVDDGENHLWFRHVITGVFGKDTGYLVLTYGQLIIAAWFTGGYIIGNNDSKYIQDKYNAEQINILNSELSPISYKAVTEMGKITNIGCLKVFENNMPIPVHNIAEGLGGNYEAVDYNIFNAYDWCADFNTRAANNRLNDIPYTYSFTSAVDYEIEGLIKDAIKSKMHFYNEDTNTLLLIGENLEPVTFNYDILYADRYRDYDNSDILIYFKGKHVRYDEKSMALIKKPTLSKVDKMWRTYRSSEDIRQPILEIVKDIK